MAERIDKEQFQEKVIRSRGPVLVEFYSDTCIPCKRMAGIVAEIEEENTGRITVYKVNANYNSELAEQNAVRSAPTFLAFSDGKEIGRLTGIQSIEEITGLFQ